MSIFDDLEGKQAKPAGAVKKRVNPFAQVEALEKQALQPKGPGKGVVRSVTDPFALGTTELIGSLGGAAEAQGLIIQDKLQFDDAAKPKRELTTAEYDKMATPGISNTGFTTSTIPEDQPLTYQGGISTITGKPVAVEQGLAPKQYTDVPRESLSPVKRQVSQLAETVNPLVKSVGTAVAKGSRRVGEDLSSWSKETVENNPQWKLEPRLENVGVTDMLTSSDYSIGDKATKVFDTLMRQMPQQGASLALTIGGAATGNAPLAYAGLSLSAAQNYALEMGGVYNDLKQAHPTMDEGELASTAAMHGVFAAVMETLPEYALVHSIPGLRKALLGEVTSKLTANKGLVKNVLTNAAKQGALEGSTESIQELSANTAKAVYDKNQELFVGMDDSAVIGALMGIITGGLAGGFNTLSESSKPDVNKLNSEELLGLIGDAEQRDKLGLSVKDVQAAQKRAATREHLQGLGLTEIYDEEVIDPYGERSQTQLYNDPEAKLKFEPLKRANIENITTLAIKNLSDEQLDFLKGNAEGLAKFGVSTDDLEYIKTIRNKDVLDASMYQSSLDNAPNEAVRKGIESYMKNRMYKQVMTDYAKRNVSDADYAKSKAKVEGSLKAIATAKSLEDIDVLSMGADVVFKKHPELEEHRPAIDKAIADRQQAIENEEYGKTETKVKAEATDGTADGTADETADETEAKIKAKPKVETKEDIAKAEILKADAPVIQTDEDGSWHALADLTSDTKIPLNLSADEKAGLEAIENRLKKAKDPEIRAKIQKQFNQALRPFIERAAKPSADPTRKVAAKPFKRLTKKDYDDTYETLSDEYEVVSVENKGLKNALKESVTPEANFIKTAEAMRDAIEAGRPDIATFLLQKYQDTRKGDKAAEEKLPTLKTLYKNLADQSANNKVNIHDLVVFTDKQGKKRVGRITAEKGQFSDQGRVSTQIGSGEYHILDTDGNVHTIPGEELSLAKEQVRPKTTDMNQDDLDVTKVPPVVDPFNEQSTPRGYKKGQAYLNRKPTKLQQTLLDAIKDGTPVPDFETVDENGGKVTLVEVKGFGQVYRATIDGLLKRGLVARNEKTGLLEALDPDAKPTKVPVKNLAADAGLTKSQAEALDIIASGAEVASDESLQLSDGKTMVRPVTFNGLKKKGLIIVGKDGNWKLVNKPAAVVKAVAKKKVTPTQKAQKKAAKPKKGSEKVLSSVDILKAELEAELAAKAKAKAEAKAKKKVVTPKDKMDTLQRIKKKFPKLSPMQEKALKLLIKGDKITVRNRKGSMVKDGIGLSTMEALKKRGVVDQKKNNEWFVKPEWFMSAKELRDLEVDVDGDYEGTLFSKKEIDMRDSDDFDAAEEAQEKPKAYITIDNLQYLESMGDDVAVDELLDKVTKIVDGTTHDSYRVYDDVFVLRADTPQAVTLLANKVKTLLAKESVNFTSALGETHAYNGIEVTTTADEATEATFERPSTMVKTQARTGISAEKITANLKAFLSVKKLPKFINVLGTYDQIPQEVKDAFKLHMIKTFHGSGTEFTEFINDYIGTGEGNQFFSVGHYSTDQEGIARWYAKEDAQRKEQTFGYKSNTVVSAAQQQEILITLMVEDSAPSYSSRKELTTWFKSNPNAFAEVSKILETEDVPTNFPVLKPSIIKILTKIEKDLGLKITDPDSTAEDAAYRIAEARARVPRHIYETTLHEGRTDEDYVDWYEHLTDEQNGKIADQLHKEDPFSYDADQDELVDFIFGARFSEIYEELSKTFGSPHEASQFLLRAGIDGVRYPVGTLSGQEGAGTNYVTYDPNEIKITKHTMFQLVEMSDEDMRAELMQLDPNGSWDAANLTREELASAFAEYRHGKGVMLSKNQVVVGFYLDGKVYLIAEHINSTKEAISSLVHEGGHWMRQNDKVFQRKYNELLDSVLKGEGKSPLEISLLDKAWTAAEKERARFEKGTGSKAKAQALVEEEVLMYYLQDLVEKKGLTTKMTVWKKLKSMFQAWLYNTFGFTPKQLKWTDEDIARYFIRSIEKNAQEKVKFENKGGTTKEGIEPVGTAKASVQKPIVGSSRLEDGFIKAKGPKAADAKQWVTSLKSWMKKGMPNQVQEELFWSNLIEWLDDQIGTVTKKQVLEYLGEKGLKSKIQVKTSSTLEGEVTEADLEDPTKYNPYIENSDQRFMDHYEANGGNRVQGQLYRMMQETEPGYAGLRLKSLEEYAENLGRADIRMRTVLRKAGANATAIDLISRFALELSADAKYQKDSLEYTREYVEAELDELITFDDAVVDAVITLQKAAAEHAAADTFINANNRKNQEYVPWENMQIDVPNVKEYFNIEIAMEGDEVYRSPHYGETPNQLATARCSVITHEGEDLLFINEVQSDLHQKGKKLGYQSSVPKSVVPDKYKKTIVGEIIVRDQVINKLRDLINRYTPYSDKDLTEYKRNAVNYLRHEAWVAEAETQAETEASIDKYVEDTLAYKQDQDKAPDLPFKTNSTTVALKEVIKAAVERGITKIAWCATPYQVKQIEGWGDLTKTDKGWESYGQSVTGSINQSVRNIPNALKKDVQKFAGGEFKTVTLDSNLGALLFSTPDGEPIKTSDLDFTIAESDGKFYITGELVDEMGYEADVDAAYARHEDNMNISDPIDFNWEPNLDINDYTAYAKLEVPFGTVEEAKAAITELKQGKTPESMRQYNMFELSPELTEIAQQGDIPMASRKEEYDKARSDKLLAQIFDPNSLNLSYKDSLIRASSIASEKMGDPKERAIAKLTNRLFTKLDIEMPTRTKDTQTTNIFTRAFSLPEYTFFNRDSAAKKAVQFALDAPEVQFETEHAILGETFHDTMGNMPKHEYKQVNDYLINTDRTGHAFSIDYKKGKWRLIEMSGRPSGQTFKEEAAAVDALVKAEQEYLKKQGFTKSMLNMVRECRGLTNRGFDVVVADMRRQVSLAKENGLAEPTVGIKNKEGKREVIALSEAIARMGDLRGSYFPRERIGKTFNLVAQKESGKKVLIPISLALPSNTEDNVVKSELKKLINAHLPLAKEIKKLKAQGFTSDEIKLVNVKAPAEAVFDAPGLLSATDSVLEAAEDALDVGMTDVERKFLEKISQEMTFSIGNIYKSKGSFSSRMQRSEDIWEGYETDARVALASYAQKIAAGTARRVTARGMLEAITGRDITFEEFQKTNPEATYKQYRSDCRRRAISAVDQKNLYTDIRLYMNHVLRPDSLTDRVVGYMKGLAVLKYIGGRVMSAAINVTNMGMAVPATIAAHTNISLAKAMAETTSAAAKYTKYRAQALEGENVLSASIKGVFAATELSASDKRIFDEIAKRGWDEAHFNQDSVRQLQSTPSKLWNTFMAHSMYMFGQTEKANRAMTIFAAYKALEKGSTFSVSSLDKAQHVSNRAHGIYGKAAKPWIVQKLKILDAPYTFFKFQHNYILNMLELGLKYNKWGDAAYMLVAPAILSGVMASPAAAAMLAICKALGLGDDPEEEFYRWFEGNLETLARFGLFGLAGVSLKGSLQFGNPIPDTSKGYLGLLGAPGAVVQDEIDAFVHAKHGRYIKALEKALPSAVGSMFKGLREHNEGVTKADYSPAFSKGQRVKGSKYEMALRVLGANPSRIAGIRERQWHADQVILKYQKKRSDIMSEYKQAVINAETGSPADLSNIMDDVLEYNKQVFAADPIYGLEPITAKSIQKTLKSAFKPTKQEMRY